MQKNRKYVNKVFGNEYRKIALIPQYSPSASWEKALTFLKSLQFIILTDYDYGCESPNVLSTLYLFKINYNNKILVFVCQIMDYRPFLRQDLCYYYDEYFQQFSHEMYLKSHQNWTKRIATLLRTNQIHFKFLNLNILCSQEVN